MPPIDPAAPATPPTTPATGPTSPSPASDEAAGAIAALRIGSISGASLTAPQAQAVLVALAGVAALATHAQRLEELVASYNSDMNAVSVSLGAAREAVASRMIIPITYDYEKASKARADLADQLKTNGSVTDILTAALKVAATFI